MRNLSFFANWCYIFSFSLLFFFFPTKKFGDYPLVSPGCELYPWLAVSCTANRAQCLAVHPAESARCSYSAYSPTNHPYIFPKVAFYKMNLQLIVVRGVIILSQVQDIALVFAELCGSCQLIPSACCFPSEQQSCPLAYQLLSLTWYHPWTCWECALSYYSGHWHLAMLSQVSSPEGHHLYCFSQTFEPKGPARL